ncbi:MAG TPA: cysteine desulfurase family protein [Acidimicrobiales bacterium]|nr:cysteine desulfurase family protein [Acidimicrobiales bacterium]
MGRHYLDHASTSPARPEVVEAMLPWLAAAADPGRVHTEGRLARAAVEDARERVAALLGARPREVVFTSGATEAIATVAFGATRAGSHVVCPAVEHSAVRQAGPGAVVSTVGVDGLGRVDPAQLAEAVRPDETALVHVQLANHEVGTIQPVAQAVAACAGLGAVVHVDAAAAAGHLAIDFSALGVDLMSVSAHKLGGPPGMGALLVRRGIRLRPLLAGGDQERGRRAGSENVAGIVGFGAAAELLVSGLEPEADAARAHTGRLLAAALAVDGVTAYGDTVDRLPHLVCLGVGGVEAEAVLIGLDQAGVAVHSGSACSSESLEPSPVLEAMGVDANRSLRVSTGWSTTDADVDAFSDVFPRVVARLRDLAARA